MGIGRLGAWALKSGAIPLIPECQSACVPQHNAPHRTIFDTSTAMLTRFIISLLRQPWSGRIIGWIFTHMSFAIPVHRLHETDSLLAFNHPSPAYPVHILIVPKRTYTSLMDVTVEDTAFLADLVETVQSLVRELGLEVKGYRLIVNGGEHQDVKHLHFHLISGVK